MALVKLRARLAGGASRVMTDADRRTNVQAVAVARGQAELPAFVGQGKSRWQEIRQAYGQAAAALDATGQSDDRALAQDVRAFLDRHPDLNATPQIFAARYAQKLSRDRQTPDVPSGKPMPDNGRKR